MASLIGVALAALALSASPTPGLPTAAVPPAIARWRPYVAEASLRFGIPESWIAAVMQAESAGLTRLNGRPIVSRAGAMGLMQLMPETWAEMRDRHGLGGDPFEPRDNVLAGAAYLRAMHDRFGYPGLFAAYNAGPGRYADHLRHGTTLPAETRAYLADIAGTPILNAAPPAAGLFFTVGRNGQPVAPGPESADRTPAADRIFVPLSAARQGPK